MDLIIQDVVTALDKIKKFYFELPDVFHDGNTLVNTEEYKSLELRFVNAFSNQFSRVSDEREEYQRFHVDVEVPKNFMWPEDADGAVKYTWLKLKENFKDIDMDKKFLTKPDFLFHACQSDYSSENQKLIIEAKVNPYSPTSEIHKDIFHTLLYANNYNFQYSVILMINYSKSKWIEKYKEYLKERYYIGKKSKHDSIYVIFKEAYDATTEVLKLSDLFEEYTVSRDCKNVDCYRCGSPMVKRLARSGFNMGNEFFGCSKFPECSAVRNIENT
ncbi:TPA: topoisomerase DNA-binding C4 zinc finger domain-containing protein [Vibrio parahaemolyticus]|uniref:topoisomerase DNA-binding C4 zinc finger domain-containing protein n=1 Tax=Vibrio parahaemolyticus TaxID=670 RepID=UPI00232CC6E5|nr:topoisomerase DNA-binding C4 zinc finger domain-containing protein [Vibrio parahaemolyticus]MDB6195697.1 topoisomerase DNA-binding C4 zinc finger domain-containing protein [Vibrio parahaemolyticus]HCH4140942.1 topoisomerase DNA-binding C4 zinc finger domain-containing protein [Vibrio parahaemolyticus]